MLKVLEDYGGALKISEGTVIPYSCSGVFKDPHNSRANGENRLSLLFYAESRRSFNSAIFLLWVQLMRVTLFLIADQLGVSGFHIFCVPLGTSSSPESNETQSYHHVKAINPALCVFALVSDTGADSAHGQLHEPLEPQPPACLTPAARPLGRRQQALPCDELHHQGPHTTVNKDRLTTGREGGRTLPLVCIHMECVGLYAACLGFTFLQVLDYFFKCFFFK